MFGTSFEVNNNKLVGDCSAYAPTGCFFFLNVDARRGAVEVIIRTLIFHVSQLHINYLLHYYPSC